MVKYFYDYPYTVKRILVVPVPRGIRNETRVTVGISLCQWKIVDGNSRWIEWNCRSIPSRRVLAADHERSVWFQELDCANNDLPRFKDREEVSRERDLSISRIITTWIATPLSDVMWLESNSRYPLFLGISLSN